MKKKYITLLLVLILVFSTNLTVYAEGYLQKKSIVNIAQMDLKEIEKLAIEELKKQASHKKK